MVLNIQKQITFDSIKVTFLILYILFNFIDRQTSNIFLLLCLLFCLIDYKSILNKLVRYKNLIISVFIFSIYITLIGFLHESPVSELDNYYRFLLLLPILSIRVNQKTIVSITKMSALFAMLHFIFIYNYDSPLRYSGTSSTAITYANLCALMFIVSLYLFFVKSKNNKKDLTLIVPALIFLLIYVSTETRGPSIGILLSMIFLFFCLKKISVLIILSFLLTLFLYIPNTLNDRFSNILDIDINDPIAIPHASIRERLFYLTYGYGELKKNMLSGIGPQNLQPRMSNYLNSNGIKSIKPRDHLHNEFLDITVKFGSPTLILLISLYLFILKAIQPQHRTQGFTIMIMLVCSQLTQSHFAHHQAITFFIVLLYLMASLKTGNNNTDVITKKSL